MHLHIHVSLYFNDSENLKYVSSKLRCAISMKYPPDFKDTTKQKKVNKAHE